MKAAATYIPTKWDEKPYEKTPEMKLTTAAVEFTYHGQMEGIGLAESVMFYSSYDDSDPHKAAAQYVGLIRFKGTLNGKKGTFVMEDRGTYGAGVARSTLTILPHSGTEELEGISGTGKSTATQHACDCELQYTLK